jgi:hypothetical protein
MVRLRTLLGRPLTNGQSQEAALNFAVPQTLGPLQSKALEQLRQIHQSSSADPPDFQRFLEGAVGKAATATPTPPRLFDCP